MKILPTLEITEFLDKDISIAEYTETGTFASEIYLTPEEQKALYEYFKAKFENRTFNG